MIQTMWWRVPMQGGQPYYLTYDGIRPLIHYSATACLLNSATTCAVPYSPGRLEAFWAGLPDLNM